MKCKCGAPMSKMTHGNVWACEICGEEYIKIAWQKITEVKPGRLGTTYQAVSPCGKYELTASTAVWNPTGWQWLIHTRFPYELVRCNSRIKRSRDAMREAEQALKALCGFSG